MSVVGPYGDARLGHLVSRLGGDPFHAPARGTPGDQNQIAGIPRERLGVGRRALGSRVVFHGRSWSYFCKAQPVWTGVEVV